MSPSPVRSNPAQATRLAPLQQRRRLLGAGMGATTLMLAGMGIGVGVGGMPRAHAQANVPKSDSSEVPAVLREWLPSARLAGSARMRVFTFDVYDARLWVGAGFDARQYARTPLALELQYLRGLKGPAIAERSLKEMRRQGPLDDNRAQRWLSLMEQTFPDVREGDRILGLHLPQQGARFWVNAQGGALIEDTEFSRLFFGIWLSEQTSEPQLRTRLLGQLPT